MSPGVSAPPAGDQFVCWRKRPILPKRVAVPQFIWPLLVIGLGLAAPFVGSAVFVKAYDRYKRDHPDDYRHTGGVEAARSEPRMWALPIGALVVAPALILVGVVWLIWLLVS